MSRPFSRLARAVAGLVSAYKESAVTSLCLWLVKNIAEKRNIDQIIGGPDDPYMLRWFVIPRNRFFNIYLHHFMRSDDDRALHDHPWSNMSILLQGSYTEHRIAAGGIHTREVLNAGDVRIRLSGKTAHRIELTHGKCWTLFLTGPKYRSWGFHCTERGWVNWRDFTDERDSGQISKGCDQ